MQLKAKVAIVAKNLTEPVKSEEYINKLCLNLGLFCSPFSNTFFFNCSLLFFA